jgi:hypothetical protein
VAKNLVEKIPFVQNPWQSFDEVKKNWPCNKIIVGNGKESTRFGGDHWLNNRPLSEEFPNLYSVYIDHNIVVNIDVLPGIRNLKF